MSGGEAKRVSREDIQLVQNLIERCLMSYMNRNEAVELILCEAKIDPRFTELVWQKLEEDNPEFFKAYRVRLMAKQQIRFFNDLMKRQVDAMQNNGIFRVGPTPPLSCGSSISTYGGAAPPLSNGSSNGTYGGVPPPLSSGSSNGTYGGAPPPLSNGSSNGTYGGAPLPLSNCSSNNSSFCFCSSCMYNGHG